MRVLFYDDCDDTLTVIEAVQIFEDENHYLHFYTLEREEGFTSERPVSRGEIKAIMHQLCLIGHIEITTFKVYNGDMYPKDD